MQLSLQVPTKTPPCGLIHEGEHCSSLCPPEEAHRYWIKSRRPGKTQTGAAAALQTHKQQSSISLTATRRTGCLSGCLFYSTGGGWLRVDGSSRRFWTETSYTEIKCSIEIHSNYSKASTQLWGKCFYRFTDENCNSASECSRICY